MLKLISLNHAGGLGLALALVLLAAEAGAQTQQRSTSRTTPGSRSAFGGATGGRTATGGATGQREYPNNTTVGDAMIASDPESRQLIIVTDDETNKRIEEVIKMLDRPKPQVLIKVVFLEVTHSDEQDLGLEGGWRRQIANSTTSAVVNAFGLSGLNLAGTNVVNNVFGQNVQSFVPTPPGAGLYQILGQDYQVTLRAIAQAGKAEVISRPSVLARNSQPATITVGQSVPLITNVRFDTFGNAINSVSYTDVGVILRVTPFITSDGLVEMIVAPELSSVSATDKVPVSTGVDAPVIDKRSADTVVVTPDGQTVIIGGLMGRAKTQSRSKIPFLGDIPLLGLAFQRNTRSDTKSELLIFLTPHIVQAPTQVSALTQRERQNSLLKPQALTEEDLNKFLDTLPVKEPEKPAKPSKSKK